MTHRYKNGLNNKIEQEQQNSFKQHPPNPSNPPNPSIPPHKSTSPLFNYPPLPKWEMRICWLISFGTVAYAWFCVWLASSKWEFKIGRSQASISNLPFFGMKIKDESNWEWFRWSPFATSQYLPLLVGHSILFNFLPVFFPERIWNKIYLVLSMAGSAWVFTPRLLLASLMQGFLILGFTLYFRQTFVVWLSALPILYVVMNHTDWIHNDVFLVLLFISYTLLSYISFCLELVKHLEEKQEGKQVGRDEKHCEKHQSQQEYQQNKHQNKLPNKQNEEKHREKHEQKLQKKHQNIQEKHQKHPIHLLERMLFYTFYQPFLFSLIVLYPEFERQYAEINAKHRNWTKIIFKCFRVAFWWAVCELCLHFVYFGSIALDTEFMQKLPKDQFVSIGMAIGAFFHLKYVVIFGLPAIFALIDGMEPPDGPICISRVSLYSKIWRGFDRGLYAFFKEYIFVPICWPTFSLPRKLVGLCISFTFVLLWHGFYHHNIVWIGLNIVELSIEFTSKAIYSIPKVQSFRKQLLSDLNFRRLLGWLQIVPFAFGLYSNFYFLGGSAIGWLFVQRIFWEETVPLRWPFILLITCGYFYTQVAMEIERCWPEKRKVCVFQRVKKEENGHVLEGEKQKIY